MGNSIPNLMNPEAIEQLRKFVDDAYRASGQAQDAAREASRAALEAGRPFADEVNTALDAAYAARTAASEAQRYANRLISELDNLSFAVRMGHVAAQDAVEKMEAALSAATAAERATAIVAALEKAP